MWTWSQDASVLEKGDPTGIIATVKQLNKAAYHGREDVRGSELWMGTQFHGSREQAR